MDNSNSSAPVLQANESERIVDGLCKLSFREVGSKTWMKQHVAFQKLNLQAHYSAQTNTDNFILEQFVTFDKFIVAIHELVLIETWAEMVFPRTVKALTKVATVSAYHILFQEAVLCNLLEVLLYHDYALESCGDGLLDLVDYCCRSTIWLHQHGEQAKAIVEFDKENHSEEPERALRQQATQIKYRSAIASVSILRFITEHINKLPLGVCSRITDAHDVMCLVIPLIENPPWVRRDRSRGKWEKLKDQTWEEVKPEDLLKLTPLEAQPWLILYNLMFDEEVRKSYEFNQFRKDTILRIRKFLNETLVDQLPLLAQVQRYLDELSIVNAPAATASQKSSLIVVQQIAEVRDHLVANTNWEMEAEFVVDYLSKQSEEDKNEIVNDLASMYGGESVEALLSSDLIKTTERQDQESVPQQPTVPLNVSKLLKAVEIAINDKTHTFVPSSEFTKQTTKRGTFVRVQLIHSEEKNGKVQGIFFTRDCTIGVTLKGSEEERIEPLVKRFHTKRTFHMESIEEPEWIKVGSLKDGLVLQLQRVPGSVSDSNRIINLSEGHGKVGELFISYQLKSEELL